MCGIVGYVGARQAIDVLMEGLARLEYRGYDSAGVAVMENNRIRVEKSQGWLAVLREKIEKKGVPVGHVGIGHTRWATHGEPSDVNSHPHSGKNVTLVHNGIVENYAEIKEFLQDKGFEFLSQTDTETLAKLMDYYYQGDPFDAIVKTLKQVRGSYALAIMFADQPDRIFAVRKESPLIIGLGEHENFVASDVPAILKYTRDYYLLDSDEIVELSAEKVVVRDMQGNVIPKKKLTADWDITAAEKSGFAHFMLKEIYEQPDAFFKTLSPRLKDNQIDLGEDVNKMLEKAGHIYFVACGTAMHAGIVGKYLCEELARIPVDVEVASEFRYRDPIFRKDDLVIVISQSGETADTLAALRLAKEHGVPVLAIVNVVGSSISREADQVLYTWAGPEIAVASTKAYTVQLAIMYMLAFTLGKQRGKLSDDEYRRLVIEFSNMPECIEKMLECSDHVRKIAYSYRMSKDMFFIGRGLDYALSQEGSLKLKEISYIHSEAYAAGELKHGTISLIVPGMPVIALMTQHDLEEKMLSNMKEVKARGADVIAVCSQDAKIPEDVVTHTIRLGKSDDLFAPLLSVVPLQLLAYHIADQKGCDVDKPRNLAKSVTVE